MQHKVKVTVIDKKLYPELQEKYCADPDSGMCSCYHVGDEFIFERYGEADDFWRMGLNTLKQTVHTAEEVAGGTRPVIFKIERMDYKAVYISGIGCDGCRNKIKEALENIKGVTEEM